MKVSFLGMLHFQFQMLHKAYQDSLCNSSTPMVTALHDKSNQYKADYQNLYPKNFLGLQLDILFPKRGSVPLQEYFWPVDMYWEPLYLGSSLFLSQRSNCTIVTSSLNLEAQTTPPCCNVYSASNGRMPLELDPTIRQHISLHCHFSSYVNNFIIYHDMIFPGLIY